MDIKQGLLPGLRPMPPRDVNEEHRAATPLELLFDLVSVIAIAAAAAGLHHAIAEAHVVEGVIRFVLAFFPIWWAWMNYTWFASAYDNDDALFRVLTMVIMAGALTMAAGITVFFKTLDLTLIVIGFVVMRVGMVALWLRAARHDSRCSATAYWYAGGISLAQCYWVSLLLMQPLGTPLIYGLYGIGVLLELMVPVLAEKRTVTTWHRHHIMERYGLLNIIVLGETLLAGSMALSETADGHFDIALVHIALSALAVLFSMWWLYFARETHLEKQDLSRALTWGYGHFIIYLSGAAVGAGFAVLADIVTHHAEMSLLAGDYAVAVPVALYLLGLWFVRDRFALRGAAHIVLPVFSALVLLAPPVLGLEGLAAMTVLCVMVRSAVARRLEEAGDSSS